MAIRTLRYFLLFATLFFGTLMTRAQNEVVHIYGQLRDDVNKKKLDGCKVTVFKDGSQADLIDTGNSGKYDLTLKLGHTYDIKFFKEGYLQKVIRLDTRNIPEEERYGGFDMNVPGTLFPEREGFNTELLKEPIAIAKYFPNADGLMFDEDYSTKKVAMIAAEHKRLDDLAKNFDKLKKQFDDLLKEGDKKMAETKYGDAMEKFQGALNIFPKDETAKAKYNDAKARFDAENANKEFEAKYKQLMADADKAYGDKKYEDAKKKYQEASAMKKDEKLPKEGIYNCEQALKDLVKRKEYDALLVDADGKFNNKDYAVSIEKYKEASSKYPNEPYPKDQIVKAELAIKAMLDDEAARLAKRKDYDSKILLAGNFEKEDNLEKAISTYREASFILPEEKLPGEKIALLEKLLAERKKKADQLAKDNSENEKREKEYNDLIKIADELFLAKKLGDSREKYVAASGVKPEASWPKTRIETIDQLMKEDSSNLAKLRQKAVEDSLNAAKLAELDELEKRKIEIQKKKDEEAEARRLRLEEERLAALNKVNGTKEKSWNSQADAEAEDEVEQYYRDAKAKEDAARNNEIRQKILENQSFHSRKVNSQGELIAQREENIELLQNSKNALAERGGNIYTKQVITTDQKKKDAEKQNSEATRISDSKRSQNQTIIETQQKTNNAIAQNDRQRTMRVAENEDQKNQAKKSTEDAQRHGDVLRRDNLNSIEKQNENQKDIVFRGEITRKDKQDALTNEIKQQQNTQEDKSKAAHEKLKNTSRQIEQQKSKTDEDGLKGGNKTTEKANEIAKQKAELQRKNEERDVAQSQRHFEKRNELNNVKTGPKQPSVSSDENLAEGVTENSYKLGNKMITERTVTVGNKVNTYKKVVSKTAIYYFKNGNSITETTWKMETLSNK